MVNYSKRMIIVRGAELDKKGSLVFVGKWCVFVSRPMKSVTFPLEKGETARSVGSRTTCTERAETTQDGTIHAWMVCRHTLTERSVYAKVTAS